MGSGKTMLLQLMGGEFEKRGKFVVYYIDNADMLNCFEKSHIDEIVENAKAQGQRAVLLIDEVHKNVNARLWSYLLRSPTKLRNHLIVVGAGIPQLHYQSPHFQYKHEPKEVLLNNDELIEVVAAWSAEATSRGITCTEEEVKTIVGWIFNYCGGHIYPILALCDHIFTQSNYQKHAKTYDIYFTSAEFEKTICFSNVKTRCFDFGFDVLIYFHSLFSGTISDVETSLSRLIHLGYWVDDWFLSQLFLLVAFNMQRLPLEKESEQYTLLNNMSAMEKIEVIIATGLRYMEKSDFHEPASEVISKMENAIGMCWFYRLKEKMPYLYIAPQTQEFTGKRGKTRPSIDFSFDGLFSVAIEVSKNSYDIIGKLNKLSTRGVYRRWHNRGAILNFQLVEGQLPNNPLVYTFDKQSNILYKGDVPLCVGICSALQTPTVPDTGEIATKSRQVIELINQVNTSLLSGISQDAQKKKRKREKVEQEEDEEEEVEEMEEVMCEETFSRNGSESEEEVEEDYALMGKNIYNILLSVLINVLYVHCLFANSSLFRIL